MEHSARRLDVEVVNFLTTNEAYTIFLEDRSRLDVARCVNKEDYLWVQATQGFFVLKQSLPNPWKVIYEIVPESFSSSFFPYVEEHFFTLLAEWDKGTPSG